MIKILVIEDEQPLLKNILELLQLENYEAIGASDGQTGIELARRHLPDLIICDIRMSGLDGFEVLQELRGDLTTAMIPFVFLTGDSERDSMRKGMELGADDYLTKPFSQDELQKAIRSQLDKRAAIENQRLRLLSHRLMEMHETVRHQVAREFGNNVSESVASLHIILEAIKKTSATADQIKLDQAQDLLTQLSVQVRDLAFDLRPSILDDLGLLPVLSRYFERYTDQTQIEVDFRHSGMEQRFQPDTEITAFRIIQEALSNVAHHASVQVVSVRTWAELDTLRIRVEDQGEGFDLETVLTSGHASGLIGMHGRATLLGGQLNIESRRGIGTCVTASLPAVLRDTDVAEAISPDTDSLIDSIRMSGKKDERHADVQQQADTQMPEATISIVLADSHDLSRQGIRSLLENEPGLSVIGEVADAEQAEDAVRRLKPDVLIIDFTLPGSSGLDVAQHVAQVSPQTKVLILSANTEEAYVLKVLRSGAMGYVQKQSRAEDLVQAVYAVAEGRRYVSPALSEQAIETYVALQKKRDPNLSAFNMLTSREREILRLITGGYTNHEIAEQLSISPRTAETHRYNMMRKLGVRNLADLIRYALQYGIFQAGR